MNCSNIFGLLDEDGIGRRDNRSSFCCGLTIYDKGWGQNEWDVRGLDMGMKEKLTPRCWT